MNNDKGKLEFANKFLSTGKEKKRMNISMDDVLDRGDFWEDIKRPSHEAHETKKKFQDLMSEGNFDTPLFKIKQGARADDARTDLNVKNDPSYLDEYVTFNDVKPKQIHSHKQSNHWNDKFQQFINKYDPDNEEEEIKKLKAKQRCINLYNNGKEKLKNLQTIQQKNTELKVKREMDQCTFKPKLNKERKLCYVINKKENKEKVVRPSKAHSQDKVQVEMKKRKEDQEDLHIKPKEHHSNLELVFNKEKSVVNDKHILQYLDRLERARKDEEEKKKRLHTNTSNKSKWNTQKPYKISCENKQISSIGLINVKSILHEELHNITNDGADENEMF